MRWSRGTWQAALNACRSLPVCRTMSALFASWAFHLVRDAAPVPTAGICAGGNWGVPVSTKSAWGVVTVRGSADPMGQNGHQYPDARHGRALHLAGRAVRTVSRSCYRTGTPTHRPRRLWSDHYIRSHAHCARYWITEPRTRSDVQGVDRNVVARADTVAVGRQPMHGVSEVAEWLEGVTGSRRVARRQMFIHSPISINLGRGRHDGARGLLRLHWKMLEKGMAQISAVKQAAH